MLGTQRLAEAFRKVGGQGCRDAPADPLRGPWSASLPPLPHAGLEPVSAERRARSPSPRDSDEGSDIARGVNSAAPTARCIDPSHCWLSQPAARPLANLPPRHPASFQRTESSYPFLKSWLLQSRRRCSHTNPKPTARLRVRSWHIRVTVSEVELLNVCTMRGVRRP